ncbi:hypothetical protein AB0K51_34465 [Kitasatospora sp. NPDC049285]|uniref:SCO4402 family protein n=1 Tax=Kitasatospora sp. NPDC049285 TaxID=3157096 RepID=UPI00344A7BB0
MIDHGIALPTFRMHLVPAVLALANPTVQHPTWLDPATPDGLHHVLRSLFTDHCDADHPLPWLGQSLRTTEEAALLTDLAAALHHVRATTTPDAYPTSPHWPAVLTTATRLAHLMIRNDQLALYHPPRSELRPEREEAP